MELSLSISQRQTLSQRMQLSVKILQMNSFDLEQFVCEFATENPLIELEAPGESDSKTLERARKLEWLSSAGESYAFRRPFVPGDDEYDTTPYEKSPADSLADALLAQLSVTRLPELLERCVRYIIDNLDENGYVCVPREQLLDELCIDPPTLELAMSALHRMEPSGVGAFDLKDCLLIQVRKNTEALPVLEELIENHLDLLAKNQIVKLAKLMRVSTQEIKQARSQLLALNPKPGNGYSPYKAIPYIRPDVFIVQFEDHFQVILNEQGQPKIEISGFYRTLAKDADPETQGYVKEKLRGAEWLLSCIAQRKNTILACVSSILRQQIGFFENGPGYLAPMTLSDVANDLGMHPSTISRAIRGKYLQCKWGAFGIAELFSHKVSWQGADESNPKSQDMVISRIKGIIEQEDPADPMSDQEITQQLQQQGIEIARRTVTKYREKLGIHPSSRRKAI